MEKVTLKNITNSTVQAVVPELAQEYNNLISYNNGDYCTYRGTLYKCIQSCSSTTNSVTVNSTGASAALSSIYFKAIKVTDEINTISYASDTNDLAQITACARVNDLLFDDTNNTIDSNFIIDVSNNITQGDYDSLVTSGAVYNAINSIKNTYTAQQQVAADFEQSVASSSKTFQKDEIVWYRNQLYKFNETVNLNSWDSTKVTPVTINSLIENTLSELDEKLQPYEFNLRDKFRGILNRNSATDNKITYTWSGEICTVTASGTTTNASVNLIRGKANFPDGVVGGGTYYVKYKTTDPAVSLRILLYTSGDDTLTTQYVTSDRFITLPSTAAKWSIALYVMSGTTLSSAVTVSDIAFLSLGEYFALKADTQKALIPYNVYDIFDGIIRHNSAPHNGIQYRWVGDKCYVSGATSSTSSVNTLVALSALPDEVIPGKVYSLKYSTTSSKVSLRVIFYDENNEQISARYAPYNLSLEIPSDATKWGVALHVAPNTTLSDTVEVSGIALMSAMTNKELEERAVHEQGLLPDATDLDDVLNPGVYAISSSNNYINSPVERGTLEVFRATSLVVLQRAVGYSSDAVYVRISNNNSFSGRTWYQISGTSKYVFSYYDGESNSYYSIGLPNYDGWTNFDPAVRKKPSDEGSGTGRCLLVPVRAGDVVRLKTKSTDAQDMTTTGSKPYAVMNQRYQIESYYADSNTFDGTISIESDGFLAVNCRSSYVSSFICEVYPADDTLTYHKKAFSGEVGYQLNRQFFTDYDDDNVTKVLKTGPSLMGVLHSWAIIGASSDSGEFNYTVPGASSMSELEWYEYSPWAYLQRINGIPEMYNYSDGGQNAKEWIALGETDGRGWAYNSNTETPNTGYFVNWETDPVTRNRWQVKPGVYGRSGIGYGGGCWWKLKQDLLAGKRYQAYVINLGGNDISNNYPFDENYDTLQSYNGRRYYTCGTTADIGTYSYDSTTGTETDVVPDGKTAGVLPGIVNSYAAYIGAIINRILAFQPDALIFLATPVTSSDEPGKQAVSLEYAQVIRDIAAMNRFKDNVIVLDNNRFGPNRHVNPMRVSGVGNHLNALGWQMIGWAWNTMIDHAIQKNYSTKIKQSMWIGTGKKYDPDDLT